MSRKNNRAPVERRVRRGGWADNRQDALQSVLAASLAASEAGQVLGGLGTDYRAPRTAQGMPKQAMDERAVIGLVRAAVNRGASVAEVAAACGRSKAWVRAQLAARSV